MLCIHIIYSIYTTFTVTNSDAVEATSFAVCLLQKVSKT